MRQNRDDLKIVAKLLRVIISLAPAVLGLYMSDA